jgi:nucleoside-diphosphate-sugar epimerase
MSAFLIVGCGYVGRRLARAELQSGERVTAVVRSAASAARLTAQGVDCLRADLDQALAPGALPTRAAVIYYLAPPPPRGATDPRLGHFLAAIPPAALPARIVLLSTSGVYGDCRGEWVSEARAPQPQADRARRRLDAEQRLQDWSRRQGVPVVILRVPGIYGPGRLPLERLHSGEPVLREEESPWSNRVHVDDLVRACRAAARHGHPGAIYNVSDGRPSTMTDYFNRVADAAGLPRPPQISLTAADSRLSEGMRSYLAESKRLDNRRMREELGVEPLYPDLATGLAACLRDEAQSHSGAD